MSRSSWFRYVLEADPRLYQITAQAFYLLFGLAFLRLEVTPVKGAVIFAVALTAQFLATRVVNRHQAVRSFDARSPAITALSLCLILRSESLVLLGTAAALAIASKYALRIRGKHLFNPATFGIVTLLFVVRPSVWTTPAQWGFSFPVVLMFVLLGTIVVVRARVTWLCFGFLAVYGALVLTRALYLGQPQSIPLHALSNGSLLLYAFHMISDPKPAPDSRMGQLVFAGLVAAFGFYLQFYAYLPYGILMSLFVCSLVIPFIDALFPKEKIHHVVIDACSGSAARVLCDVPRP